MIKLQFLPWGGCLSSEIDILTNTSFGGVRNG